MPPLWLLGIVLAVLVSVGYPFFVSDYYIYVAVLAFLASIGAIGTNVLIGRAGLVSIGNAAFMAIASWTIVLVSSSAGFLVSVLAGAFTCAVLGVVIGIPSLRLRNFYMALTTLALHFIVVTAYFQYENAVRRPDGFYLPIASVGPVALGTVRSWYVAAGVALTLVLVLTGLLFSSRVGRAWLAIREHDVAAAVVGVNVTYFKLLAFAVSSFIIGLGGGLNAYFTRYVTAEAYTLDLAISFVAMIIIGGLGSLTGSVIGAFIITFLPLAIENVGSLLPPSTTASSFLTANLFYIESAIYGALVLVFLYKEPLGIAGLLKRLTISGLRGRRAGMTNFDFPTEALTQEPPMKPVSAREPGE